RARSRSPRPTRTTVASSLRCPYRARAKRTAEPPRERAKHDEREYRNRDTKEEGRERTGITSRLGQPGDHHIEERAEEHRKSTREGRAAAGEEYRAKGRELDVQECEDSARADPLIEA